MARRHQTACHVLAGQVSGIDESVLREHGIASATAITPTGTPLRVALAEAEQNLQRAAEVLVRSV
ncbi:Uncharacterised protein [Mycobacteroides abscessus subsp. abscessus]|nr:Uncharacterised protein [Mycobacteroides abscessus subsp. abscessus]